MATTIGSLDLNAFSGLYDDSTQYFWFESNASATYGAGVHVTLVPDTTFISNPTGQNILMNTDGFSIRNGLLPMMTLDNDSLDFNVVDTTAGTYVTTATFTSTGAQIGQSSGAHSVIDANGQRFYASDGTTQLANIGYGEGTDSSGGEDDAPYYTLGRRNTITPTVGNYSVVEGNWCTASAYCSHAEGSLCYATGYCSHAEGMNTISRGDNSHAEGDGTTASGLYSHAEGSRTTASALASHAEGSRTTAKGMYSHAQNLFTVATEEHQTVIGKYNSAIRSGSGTTADPYTYSDAGYYAFIIGNGTDDATASRSNALTVDWNGNVDLPTGKFSGVGTTLTYDASNSGTNALEINNASSNALTVDWDGKIRAPLEVIATNVTTTTTGTYVSSACYRFGRVVFLSFTCRNTSSVAAGSNIYVGTFTNTLPRPVVRATGATYYGLHTVTGAINANSREITIRNSSSTAFSIPGTNTVGLSLIYLTDD